MRFTIRNLMILIALAAFLLGGVIASRRFFAPRTVVVETGPNSSVIMTTTNRIDIGPAGYLLPAAFIGGPGLGIIAWRRRRRHQHRG